MKKSFYSVLAVLLLVALTACNGGMKPAFPTNIKYNTLAEINEMQSVFKITAEEAKNVEYEIEVKRDEESELSINMIAEEAIVEIAETDDVWISENVTVQDLEKGLYKLDGSGKTFEINFRSGFEVEGKEVYWVKITLYKDRRK